MDIMIRVKYLCTQIEHIILILKVSHVVENSWMLTKTQVSTAKWLMYSNIFLRDGSLLCLPYWMMYLHKVTPPENMGVRIDIVIELTFLYCHLCDFIMICVFVWAQVVNKLLLLWVMWIQNKPLTGDTTMTLADVLVPHKARLTTITTELILVLLS